MPGDFLPYAARWRDSLQRLRSNRLFEWATISIILLSALAAGVKSYDIPATESALGILDRLFTAYFAFEIAVRILAEDPRTFWRRGWNVFDFTIVAVSLIPIQDSESVFIARLLRLFLVRLIIVVPHLRALVESLIAALPRIGYVALMMFIIFYMYGAVGNLFFKDINSELWGNIGLAMLTLFRVATLEGWTKVMYETMEVFPMSWIFFVSFIFLSAFIFLNMMIGVIISTMQETSRANLSKTASAPEKQQESAPEENR